MATVRKLLRPRKGRMVGGVAAALGAGGRVPDRRGYQLDVYNPSEFLELYLNLCMWSGKNPAEPYRQTFVPVIDMDGYGKGKEPNVLDQARNMVPYPVIYARHRLDIEITPKNANVEKFVDTPPIEKKDKWPAFLRRFRK